MEIIPYQEELRPALPTVIGNVDSGIPGDAAADRGDLRAKPNREKVHRRKA